MTPPTSTISVSSYDLRNRTQSKLVYDVKYHPMDDTIRPSQAAKRRTAHGEVPILDSDDASDAFTLTDTAASIGESSDTRSEDDEEAPRQSKQTKLRPLPAEGTRRSTRKVSNQKTSYNMDIHPQDKYLVISSDDDDKQTPSNKRREITRKRPNADDSSVPDIKMAKKPRVSYQDRSRRTDLGTSDSLDFSGVPIMHSVETGGATKHSTYMQLQYPHASFN